MNPNPQTDPSFDAVAFLSCVAAGKVFWCTTALLLPHGWENLQLELQAFFQQESGPISTKQVHIDGSKMKNQSTGKTSISFCKAFNSCLTFTFLIHFEDSGVLYFHSNREITSFLVTFVTRLPSSLCCFCSRFNCPPPLHAEPLPPNTTFSRNLQKSKQENSYQASTGPKKAEPRPRGANPRGFWSASG